MNFGEAAFALAQPSNALFALLALGWIVALVWRRLGLALVAVAVVLLGVLGLTPAGEAMLRPLEAAVPTAGEVAAPTGIILLGGYVTDEVSPTPDDVALNESSERLIVTAELARRFPAARVIVTDGSVDPTRPTGADVSAVALEALGVPRERLVIEGRALSTWDNAAFSRELVRPKPGETWVLVTSAWHMSRSLKTFAGAGWTGLVPYAVDYRTTWRPLWRAFPGSLARGLTLVDLVAREYLATLAYRFAGRFDPPPG